MSDYALGSTIYWAFTTRAFATGVPTALAGSPTLEIYENDSVTPIVEGASKLVLTQNLNSINGFNLATITATSGNGFEAGKNYHLIIKTGTVGGTSVVGEVVGRFTIDASSALKPTVAGRTLDVSAGGEAGVDWANVGSPTTTLALTGTTIATTQKVDVETIKTNPVVNAGTVTFPTGATLASTTNITAGTVTTATNVTTVNGLAANVITAASMAADASAEIADAVWDEALAGHAGAGSAGEALAAAGTAGDPWTTTLPGGYTGSQAGKILADVLVDTAEIGAAGAGLTNINLPDQTMNITGDITGNLSGSVGSVTGAVGSVTGAVGSVTGNVGGNVVGSVGSVTGNVGGNVAGSVGSLTTNNDKTGYALSATGSAAMTEGYAALGATATLPQILYEIRALLAEKSISSTTLTTKKLDGVTSAATYTLDDATTPSAITRAT